MCDTLYRKDGDLSWFAKNSDRHPDEPQCLCMAPRRAPEPESAVGQVRFGQPDRGLSFALSRPSWMAGGEMGLNEAGVSIGNEAVFPRHKDKARRDGTLGMDILRSALGHARSAAEARDFICAFVEAHEQGGNGAYKGNLVYSNSFLVADRNEAYVVETAGRRWAYRKAGAAASISNAYSIASDFDGIDARTGAELKVGGRSGASFKDLVQDPFYLLFTRGERRQACTLAALSGTPGTPFGFETTLAALRTHDASGRGRSMSCPCLHEAGFPLKSTTTASLIVEYLAPAKQEATLLWFSGTPYPCLSVFAPVILSAGRFHPLWRGYNYEEGSGASLTFWQGARARASALGGARRSVDPAFARFRDEVQEEIRKTALEVAAAAGHGENLERLESAASASIGGQMARWDAFVEGAAAEGHP